VLEVLRGTAGSLEHLEHLEHIEHLEQLYPLLPQLRGRRIDSRPHFTHPVAGKAAALRVLADESLVRGDVQAVDLVVGHGALHPLKVRSKLAEHLA